MEDNLRIFYCWLKKQNLYHKWRFYTVRNEGRTDLYSMLKNNMGYKEYTPEFINFSFTWSLTTNPKMWMNLDTEWRFYVNNKKLK